MSLSLINWEPLYKLDSSLWHPVTSSRVQPPATTAEALLHLTGSLAFHLILLMECPFMLSLSNHLAIDLPHFLFHLISPSITSFSIPRSSLTTCPKYLKAACATRDSNVRSGFMFSSTRTFVFLSIHDAPAKKAKQWVKTQRTSQMYRALRIKEQMKMLTYYLATWDTTSYQSVNVCHD